MAPTRPPGTPGAGGRAAKRTFGPTGDAAGAHDQVMGEPGTADAQAFTRAPGSSWRKTAAALGGAVSVTSVFWLWLVLRIGGTSSVRSFDDLGTLAAAAVASIFCVRAGLLSSAGSRRFWLLLGAASIAWTAAESVWATYDLVLGVPVPVPSWADVGYLTAIPLAVAALASHPSIRRGRTRRARATLDGLAIATASLFLSWTLVLGPLWRHTELSSLGGVVAVAYPFGDVVMITLVLLVLRAAGGSRRFSLLCVLGGVMAMALADSAYTYLREAGSYATGNVVDVGWVAGYLGLALGAYCSRWEEPSAPSQVLGDESLAALVTPLISVLLALLFVAGEAVAGRTLDRAEWLMALTLTLLVLVRQFLFLVDQRHQRELGGETPGIAR